MGISSNAILNFFWRHLRHTISFVLVCGWLMVSDFGKSYYIYRTYCVSLLKRKKNKQGRKRRHPRKKKKNVQGKKRKKNNSQGRKRKRRISKEGKERRIISREGKEKEEYPRKTTLVGELLESLTVATFLIYFFPPQPLLTHFLFQFKAL